jgi:hypothetical protein
MYSGYLPIHLRNNDEGSLFFWLENYHYLIRSIKIFRLSSQRNYKPDNGPEHLIVWLVRDLFTWGLVSLYERMEAQVAHQCSEIWLRMGPYSSLSLTCDR